MIYSEEIEFLSWDFSRGLGGAVPVSELLIKTHSAREVTFGMTSSEDSLDIMYLFSLNTCIEVVLIFAIH